MVSFVFVCCYMASLCFVLLLWVIVFLLNMFVCFVCALLRDAVYILFVCAFRVCGLFYVFVFFFVVYRVVLYVVLVCLFVSVCVVI